MQYLKKYNETVDFTFWFKEVKQFCEESLAYLIDKDINVKVVGNNIFGKCGAFINIEEHYLKITTFKWNDVKDSIIPFIVVLDSNYKIYDIEFVILVNKKYFKTIHYSHKDIINDNIDSDFITKICITILSD